MNYISIPSYHDSIVTSDDLSLVEQEPSSVNNRTPEWYYRIYEEKPSDAVNRRKMNKIYHDSILSINDGLVKRVSIIDSPWSNTWKLVEDLESWRPFGIVSAWLPDKTKDENLELGKKLFNEGTEHLRYGYISLQGGCKNNMIGSFMFTGVEMNDLIKLGITFGQEQVLFGNRSKMDMINIHHKNIVDNINRTKDNIKDAKCFIVRHFGMLCHINTVYEELILMEHEEWGKNKAMYRNKWSREWITIYEETTMKSCK